METRKLKQVSGSPKYQYAILEVTIPSYKAMMNQAILMRAATGEEKPFHWVESAKAISAGRFKIISVEDQYEYLHNVEHRRRPNDNTAYQAAKVEKTAEGKYKVISIIKVNEDRLIAHEYTLEQINDFTKLPINEDAQYTSIHISHTVLKKNLNLDKPQEKYHNSYVIEQDEDVIARLAGKAVIEGEYNLLPLGLRCFSEKEILNEAHDNISKNLSLCLFFIVKLQSDASIAALVVYNLRSESCKEYSLEEIKEMLKSRPQIPVSESAKEIDPAIASYVKQLIKEETLELRELFAALQMKVEEQERELKVLRAQGKAEKGGVKDEVNKAPFGKFTFGNK